MCWLSILFIKCWFTHFFISNTFTPGWNWQKIKQKLRNTVRLILCYIFEYYLHSKISHYFIKMKNRSLRYDINSPMSRHGHKYRKYRKCLSMMMLIGIKQHLSNIWSSIHQNLKQHRDWVEKKCCLNKKACSIDWNISRY